MFHLKDIRRRNVSSSPYLSSRALEPPSTASNYDPINEHDIPAHDLHIRTPPNIATSHEDLEVEDVLAPGDIVGKGSLLKGDVVSLLPTDNDEDEDEQFQVIKELGKGSYAVVYLVHQVFFTRGASAPNSASSGGRSNTADSSEDGHILGHMDSEEPLAHQPTKTYGRKFAIKCLSKANLDKEELDVQMAEVTIHQSLPLHSNIVALHKTLQTSSYLLLVLEYVPGEDLFYFLQQARDHYPPFPPESLSPELLLQQQQTPPTPSLLSSSHPSHLLSRIRLRLIASMFAQMCDAVATCHAVGVFHRDIKPENFIVTDGRYLDEGTDRMNNKGRVVVKLTDFGLSTREEECSDMDCGSAPYMSYECRNNIAPTYRPREADVWSLGIVLINMLYHINPWTDTAHGVCPSFTAFRQDPVGFFTRLFTGMTPHVAGVLAWRVFGVDNEQTMVNGRVKEKRMTAAELGVWVRSNLVDLLAMDDSSSSGAGGVSASGVNGGTSTARVVVNGGHRLSAQMRISHRPLSRAASPFGRLLGSVGGVGGLGVGCAVPSPRLLTMALSRAPSLAPALVKEEGETEVEVEGDMTLQIQEEMEAEERREQGQVQQHEEETEQTDAAPSRASTRRRKRGLRNKGKGAVAMASQQQDQQQHDETLKTLADASQSLVREISNVKTPSVHQLQLQHPQQPSSSSSSVICPNQVNGDGKRVSLASSESGASEISGDTGSGGSSKTVLTTPTTTPPPSMMSMVTEAMAGKTNGANSSSISFSCADSTRSSSKGSSLCTPSKTITTSPGGGRSKARPRRTYEPVSMYPVPFVLLGKPVGAGGEGGMRTPSQLSTSSGTSVAGSGSGTQSQSQVQQQPKAITKRSSKWMLKWKNNNNSSSGGNNVVSTSVAPTLSTPTSPVIPTPSPTTPTPRTATVTTSSASDSSSVQGHARTRPKFIPIILPGHVSTFPTLPGAASPASGSAQSRDQAREPSRFIPIGAPGHVINFPSARPGFAETPAKTQSTVMSPIASNVTNLIRGLDPASPQLRQPFHQNESSGSLVGASGNGGGYAASTTSWRGRRGKGDTGDSMVILSGAAAEGSSPYKPKSPSRSPGPGAQSFTSGFGSSASSSNVSLVSSSLDIGQGQDGGWYWRDKRSSDRMRMESRGMGYSGGVGGPGASGGSRGVVRSGATGFGAGGGRHGSVAAAGGPFVNHVLGSNASWRANNAMGAMSSNVGVINAKASGSGSGGASLHGSVSASGTASPGASTIALTRFSNSSVSTMATTISTGSGTANWRNGTRAGAAVAMTSTAADDGGLGLGTSTLGGKANSYGGPNLPKTVKTVDGILNELSQGQQPSPDFGSPPVKKARTRNKKGNKNNNNNIVNGATSAQTTAIDTDAPNSNDLNSNNVASKLDTIIERPLPGAPDSSIGQQDDATLVTPNGGEGPNSWKEASTSTTDLVAAANTPTSPAPNAFVNDEGTAAVRVKKVNRGQITTLAKMLSALRR